MSLKRWPVIALIFVVTLSSCQSEQTSTTVPTQSPATIAAADTQPPSSIPIEHSTITPRPVDQPLPVIFDDDGSPDGTVALLYLLSHQGVS